mgnify:CR=1 FL=1
MSGDDVVGAGQQRGDRQSCVGIGEAPPATGQSWVVTQSSADRTTTSQPRPSGRDKPGDSAQRLADSGEEVVAGLLG